MNKTVDAFFGVYSLSGALKCFTDGMELLVGLQARHTAPIFRAIPESDLQSTFYQFTYFYHNAIG